MEESMVNLDLLATHLRNRLNELDFSLRKTAEEIGCSPATLSRLLKGSKSENTPDYVNLIKAASWLGKSLSEFESGKLPQTSTLTDVEVHLRALPGLKKPDAEALVAMVKAYYDSAKNRQPKKKS